MKKYLLTGAGVLLGNVLVSFAVAAFVLPHGLIMGGATGISLALNHVTGLPLPALVFVLNGLLFIVGAVVLGKRFALTTVVSTAMYPLLLGFFQMNPAVQNLTEDILLATIYAGLLLGLGIGIVIRMGASTGGTDILALVLNRKLHIPVAIGLYGADFLSLTSQMWFSSSAQILYGILILLLTAVVISRISVFGQSQMQLTIISKAYEQIRKQLLEQMDVGATMFNIETGYEEKVQQGILCVVSSRRMYAVKEMILETDPEAFITITNIHEVRGRGFSLDRIRK